MQMASEHNKLSSPNKKHFTDEDQKTWRRILEERDQVREEQVVDIFNEGLIKLKINAEQIPNLQEVNERLMKLTGFQGVYVEGLEDGSGFYKMLSNREFPIGHFIREAKDLSYTPEPDIVHDLYGHLPFFTNSEYSDFCEKFGRIACQFLDRKDLLCQFERFFWFTIEFGLIKTPKGVRIFGAGIASSTEESHYALSQEPEVLPFDVDVIRQQEFRIDEIQKKLFLLESTDQLYRGLDELYFKVQQDS